MPRLQVQKVNAVGHEDALGDSRGEYFAGPPAAGCSEFFSTAWDTCIEEYMSLNKLESGYNDVKQGPYLTMNGESEHYGPLEVPEDWPAPLDFKPPGVASYFMPWTQLGWSNKKICDMTGSSTSADVYDVGSASKTGGVISIGGEHMRYSGASQGGSGGTFSGLVRGYDGTAAAPHYGHDMGSVTMGPPPVPPDTVHDSVSLRVPGRQLCLFITMGSRVMACYPATANYAPARAANGIFMPVLLRMISWMNRKQASQQ